MSDASLAALSLESSAVPTVEWDVAATKSSRAGRSGDWRRRAAITPTERTWREAIQANAPAVLIGIGVTALGAYLLHRLLTLPASRGGRKRSSKKLRIPGDGRASSARTHGLIVDDPNAPRTPVGLRNVGNSCFLNALLQALQSSEPFLQYLLRLQSLASQLHSLPPAIVSGALHSSRSPLGASSRLSPAAHPVRRPLEFLTALLHLLVPRATVGGATGAPLNPLQFYSLLVSEASGQFAGFDQQDAHELFAVLMDILERKANEIQEIKRAVNQMAARDGFEALLPKSEKAQGDAMPQPSTTVAASSTAETDTDGASEPTSATAERAGAPSSSASSSSSPPPVARSSTPSPSPLISSLSAPAFTVPSDPFRGLLAQFLLCTSCHTASSSSIRHTEFNSLTLHFEGRGAGSILNANGNDLSLESMLRGLVQTEAIEGVRCEQCKWSARMTAIKAIRAEAEAIVTKGGKSQKKKSALLRLLDDAENITRDRLLLLQPTSGEYLKRKREERMQMELKEMQRSLRNDSNGAATESQPSDEFLSSSASSDPLLSTASPPPDSLSESRSADFFLTLASRLAEAPSDDGSDLASQLPSGFVHQLGHLCALDVKRTFAKGSAIARLPPSVCFHLARLLGGAQSKVSAHVSFPLRLSLQRYTSEFVHGEQATHVPLSASGKNAGRFRAVQQLRTTQAMHPSEAMVYELDAVVVHVGGGAGGHYIAYRRQVQRQVAVAPAPANPAPTGAPKSMASSGVQFDEVASDPARGVDASSDGPAESDGASVAPAGAFALPSTADDSARLVPPPPVITWWYASDAEIREVEVEEVLRAQAYLLIYTQKA